MIWVWERQVLSNLLIICIVKESVTGPLVLFIFVYFQFSASDCPPGCISEENRYCIRCQDFETTTNDDSE